MFSLWGILEENQYLHPLLLKTNIGLYEVVRCCGFFCQFALQVILRVSHWKTYLLKLYLCNSKRILIFGEEWDKTFIFLSSEEPPRLIWSHSVLFPLLLVLDKWYLWMVIMFHFTLGVGGSTSQSSCEREPVPGEQCGCHWKVRVPYCSVSAHEKGEVQGIQLLRPLAFCAV